MPARGLGDQKPAEAAKMRTVDSPRTDERDVISNRYEINLSQELPEYSNEVCKAYVAIDRNEEYENLYALIGDNHYAFRDRATEAMQKGIIPHLIRCHATGAVVLSSNQHTRRAFIMQRPKGKKLSEILQHSGPLPENFIVKQVVRPLSQMLTQLKEHGINHGCLNLDTIYYEKEITVELCSAVPSGLLQKTPYEALERLMAMPAAKGAGDISADYYALGVITLHLILGYLPHADIEPDLLVDMIIEKGAYNTHVPEVDISEVMQDLLRGTINENRAERWDVSQIRGWLGGKRYSLLPPSAPKDSVRPFEYRGKQYYTRRGIAHALFKDWKMAKATLSAYKLLKWLETNIRKTDVCEQFNRSVPVGDDEHVIRPLKDDEMARCLAVIDPDAPVRFQLISINVDGLGTILVESMRKKNDAHISDIMSIVGYNLLAFADNLMEDIVNPVSSLILWRLQNLRPIMKTRSLGFGQERILYQMNPSLCCQHPLLLPHYVYTIDDMLLVLDKLAENPPPGFTLVDRHIAAFLTNRMEINREVRIVELLSYSDLAYDDRLVMLKILTLAQQQSNVESVSNLAKWAAEMIIPTLATLHQRSLREKIAKKMRKAGDRGMLERIAFPLFNRAMIEKDHRDFHSSQALYRFHKEMLFYMSDAEKLRLKARASGQQIAWYVGGFVLGLVIYFSTRGFI